MADIDQHCLYRAENAGQVVIRLLDELTLIYHRRSGVTHMVTEPVPQILAVMKGDALSAGETLSRLSEQFDLDAEENGALLAVIAARLEELADLGLVERL